MSLTTRSFTDATPSIRQARRFVADELQGLPSGTVETAALLVSELVTNCIRHAGTPFAVRVNRRGRSVRIEVEDSGAGIPTMRSPRPAEISGRGLQIVDRLADEWGTKRAKQRSIVWFRLDTSG